MLLWILLLGLILPGSLDGRHERKPILAILPFSVVGVEDPEKGVFCPVCNGIRRAGEILAGSEKTLTRFVYEKMETNGTFQVIPMKRVEAIVVPSERKSMEKRPVLESIRIGKTLNADFVCIGILFRFEERIGSSLGVERPASVSFDLHLIRLRDEKMVWLGKFDETQKPLSENLLKIGSFIRRKGSWLTAAELASVGIDEVLKKLPALKELEQ